MIVLLSYSINSLGNSNADVHPSTGVVDSNDSVLIAYDDLRIANSKMIELKYEKEKNNLLKFQHQLDSLHIMTQKDIIDYVQDSKRKAIKQRNAAIGGTGISVLGLILVLLFK